MPTVTSKYLLKLVSRSFAICIPLLDKNKRVEIENQYLLARFLDTIEDSSNSLENKISLSNAFINILESEDMACLNDIKKSILNDSVSVHDRVLIENSYLVFKIFFSFKENIKKVSIHYLKEMSNGMMKYQDKKVYTFEEFDDYCYYVASTVGLYLTDIVSIVDNINLDKNDAIAFGRLLQKINILKDAKLDLKDNRFFLPLSLFENDDPSPYFNEKKYKDKSMIVLDSIISNIEKELLPTFRYIKSIENNAAGYRKFTLIASIMAYKTFVLMKNNYNIFIGEPVKMNRNDVMGIILKTKMGYYTNDILDNYLGNIII